MVKTCYKCDLPKDLEDFPVNRTRKDGRGTQCRTCHKQYMDLHYQRNKASYIARAAKHTRARRDFIRRLKEVPCTDCGNSYHPCAMDFDHRPGTDKQFDVSGPQGVNVARATLMAEIAKCDVVCAVCHRLRTHQRQNE